MFARLPPALVLTLAIMAGASMDATIKWLAQSNHVLLVAFGRYLFGTLFSLIIWWRAGHPVITAEMWRAHGLRGFVIAICAVAFFWSLSVLPLAEAVALSFIYPLLAPFVAAVILKEHLRAPEVICLVTSLIGVVFIAQPTAIFGADTSPASLMDVGIALMGALASGTAYTLVRKMRTTEHPLVVVFYLMVAKPA